MNIIKAGTPFRVKGFSNMFVSADKDVDPDKTYLSIDSYGEKLYPWLLVSNSGLSISEMIESGFVKHVDGVWQNHSRAGQVSFIRIRDENHMPINREAPFYDMAKPKLLCQLQDIKPLVPLGPIVPKTTYLFDNKEFPTLEEAEDHKSELAFARNFTQNQINFIRSNKRLALKYLFGAE